MYIYYICSFYFCTLLYAFALEAVHVPLWTALEAVHVPLQWVDASWSTTRSASAQSANLSDMIITKFTVPSSLANFLVLLRLYIICCNNGGGCAGGVANWRSSELRASLHEELSQRIFNNEYANSEIFKNCMLLNMSAQLSKMHLMTARLGFMAIF